MTPRQVFMQSVQTIRFADGAQAFAFANAYFMSQEHEEVIAIFARKDTRPYIAVRCCEADETRYPESPIAMVAPSGDILLPADDADTFSN